MSYLKYLFAFILFAFVFSNSTSALSFKEFMGQVVNTLGIANAQTEDKKEIRTENVQNIVVFEAEKNLKAVSQISDMAKKVMDNENVSLEVGEDNFYAGESMDNVDEEAIHSDNAIYKVRPGESIYSISSYFSLSPETILGFNKITAKDLKPDMILEIPPQDGLNYTIQKGDTLKNLAVKYQVDIDDITLFNGLTDDEKLGEGDEIFLPGAKVEKNTKTNTKSNTKNIAKNSKSSKDTIASLGSLAKYAKNFGKGSTAQFSKLSDIKKYFNLPKFPGYYIYPAPGTNRTQTMHGHNGSDFAGRIGIPVIASAGGTVKVAKSSGYNYGYGNYIIIKHSNGTETVYGHLSAVNVFVGQVVSQGEKIGALGSSGNSTGPHLHFEIRGAYNPWAW